ncbi:MAG: hypothetical protein ACKVX7_07660 [Planctomycetota bacterium]
MSRVRWTLGGWAALAALAFASPVSAQFTPDVATSFATLNAGAATASTQDYLFFDTQEGPSLLSVAHNKGSYNFTGIVVGADIGTITLSVFLDNPFPLPDVTGEVVADVFVTSVIGSELLADAVVTFVTPALLPFLALIGIPDPSGETAFVLTYNDLPGDTGTTLTAADAGALPTGAGTLAFDIPIEWISDPFYVHSPAGGTLTVTSTITSPTAAIDTEVETFALVGGGLPGFTRGDVSGDASVQINDAIAILSYLFSGGATPSCLDAADCNDNGAVGIDDAIFVLGYLFQSTTAPPAPGPTGCGPDPTTDALTCDAPAC